MSTVERAPRKTIFGWCMFDFANSSYVTVIITVIFGPIFTQIIVPSSGDVNNPYAWGNTLWAIALAVSNLLCVFLGPFFGSITDLSGSKKKFLFISYIVCGVSTAGLWFVSSSEFYYLAVFIIICSNLAFSLGENFISSFLPSLGPKKDLGKISGMGWAIGYFGGLGSVALVKALTGETTMANFENLRMVGPWTALFFFVAGIPTFLFLKEPKITNASKIKKSSLFYLKLSYQEIKTTIAHLNRYKDLAIFLIALFFTLASFGIVISFTFIYGKQVIGLTSGQEVILFVVTQIMAATGAFLLGFIQDKIGVVKTFMWTIVMWIVSILLIFYTANITAYLNAAGIDWSIATVFSIFAGIASINLGSTASASRAIVSLFSPKDKSGEFFGLWGISGKVANALGLFALGWLSTIFGLRASFLIMIIFFTLSLIMCFFVDEERGIKQASS